MTDLSFCDLADGKAHCQTPGPTRDPHQEAGQASVHRVCGGSACREAGAAAAQAQSPLRLPHQLQGFQEAQAHLLAWRQSQEACSSADWGAAQGLR